MSFDITVEELKERLDKKEKIHILDVREQYEFDIANLGGTLIPLAQLSSRLRELNPTEEIIVLCHSGNRSARAVRYLHQQGFTKARNLKDGIRAWSERIDHTMKKY